MFLLSTLSLNSGTGGRSSVRIVNLSSRGESFAPKTGIDLATDPVAMADSFRLAVEAGRKGYEAGLMQPRDFASPSTPVVGTPFWHVS